LGLIPVATEQSGKLTFVRILSGALAIGHRPPLRALPAMKRAGVTHIATVLSRAESAETIGAAVKQTDLEWIWIELGSTKTLPARRKPEIVDALITMASVLEAGGRIYLHCSAGIHRTGMIAAALLFHLGRDEAQTKATLAALRPLTATDVGEARLEWGRSFAGTS
jgi:predicted protein tyrosine phosphatase